MSAADLYSRTMRGLLANAAIDRMGEAGLLISDQPTIEVQPDSLTPILERFSGRVVRSARKMIPVYATYFSFENAVREFVAETMKDGHGDAWWDKVPARIKTSVETRKKQMEKHKWYTYQPPSNVSQLCFGDLASIITDQWPLFEAFFPNQEWVRVRLNEM
ncbi:MAG: hypothetical protein WBV67_11780 [Candidatus Cybelea sp.]